MTESMSALMRSGMISGKAAQGIKNATLSQTRSQKGKMVDFDNRSKDEGSLHQAAQIPSREIDAPMHQKDRVSSMPSSKKGGASGWLKSEGKTNNQSRSTMGGRVGDTYAPGKKHIDGFPQKQAKTFPAGAGYSGGPSSKTGNTRMKGRQPVHSGGPMGGNAGNKSYYGGPKGRDGT